MLELYSYLTDPHRMGLNLVATGVCVLAAYTAFSLAVKPGPEEKVRYPWLLAAGVAIGSGAWAVNLIMLLGYQSKIPFAFHFGPIVLALAIGIVGSGFGIYLARRSDQMYLGGAIVGLAIAAAFYAGIIGIQFSGAKTWDIGKIAVSLVLGTSCGAAAFARGRLSPDLRGRAVSTLVLSAGIMGVNLVGLSGLDIHMDPSIAIPKDTTLAVLFGVSLTAVVMLIIGLGVVGSLVDRYVDQIESAKDALEVRVAERTEQLSSAMERIEVAARAKSAFLASMSHELRTPLNAIIGFSELISRETMGTIGERYRDYVTDIHKSGKHLLSLVNDVLDLSKLESGKFELHECEVNIADVLDASRSMVIGLAQECAVKLAVDADPMLEPIWADPLRIKQIVVNLLSNAIKFSHAGGRVACSAHQRGDGALEIRVQDEGIGMSPEDIQKALEPFGQVDNRLNRKQNGTGLGIPLVKHLIELHGGTLNIFSRPNEGTTVVVLLPGELAIHQAMAS